MNGFGYSCQNTPGCWTEYLRNQPAAESLEPFAVTIAVVVVLLLCLRAVDKLL